jgi:BON domain
MMTTLVRKAAKSRLAFLAAGAALMYLYDPERGRSRRTRMVSHAEGRVRRAARSVVSETEGEVHYLQGVLKGKVVRARHGGRYHPESDVDLREHLRQVIHTLPVPTTDVNVDAAAGVATLRGQVATEGDRLLITNAVREVPGVAKLVDYTHLPGTDPPNKAAVLHLH